MKTIAVALAGNPNAGKTTLFNALTGRRQRVANYPGVTVERREGQFEHRGHRVAVCDLPGTYSLTAVSEDERVARDFLVERTPDLVVNVVDASNLERNLYLSVQFMEMGLPLVLVLNKTDLAEGRGVSIDTAKLASLLNVTVVETVGHEGRGIEAVKDAVLAGALGERRVPAVVTYGDEIEAELRALTPRAESIAGGRNVGDPRWHVLKLMEDDPDIVRRTKERGAAGMELLSEVAAARERLHRHFGDIAEVVIAERRYGFISGACQEAVESTTELRHSASDRIDEIVTNRIVGLPIFLVLMYALFKVTFTLGAIPMDWLEHFFSWLGRTVSACWPWDGGGALRSLVVDGAIAGVGGVLVFVPNVVFLFAGIAFLEDSGYMARGAFLTDRLMHRIGLHGRSFIPMVLGFGCSVPAILATRTLGNRRDRMATLLVLPLISCGARFPIYALFAAAFFPAEWRARVIMMLYLLGIALAALLAKLLRATLFRGDTTLFVMELPPYRVPTFRAIWSHTWERLRLFLRKAATVIVAASVLLWFLTNYPKPDLSATHGLAPAEARAAELAASAAGRIGHALEPAMRHVGFDWRTTTALIGAVAAKEIFVAQLGILFSQGEGDARSESLRRALQEHYNPLQAFCIMLFCLISVPCVATLGATGAETGAWRWAFLQFAGLTLLAYGVTFVVYQAGMVLGVGVG